MPWRVKRQLYLFACGFGALGIAIAVFARNRSLDYRLLAILGFLVGVAILLTSLPANGD